MLEIGLVLPPGPPPQFLHSLPPPPHLLEREQGRRESRDRCVCTGQITFVESASHAESTHFQAKLTGKGQGVVKKNHTHIDLKGEQ